MTEREAAGRGVGERERDSNVILSLSAAQGKCRSETSAPLCISTFPFFCAAEPIMLIRGTSVLKISHTEPDTRYPLLLPPLTDSLSSLCLKWLPPLLPILSSDF